MNTIGNLSVWFSAILLVALIMGNFLPTLEAIAAPPTKNVNFEQYTFERVPGNSMSLRGFDAELTCSNGDTVVAGPLFDFEATRAGSESSGSWGMIAAPGAAAGDRGIVEKAIVSSKYFRLTGTWLDVRGTGNSVTCFGSAIPTEFAIYGVCGIDQVVTFSASNGVKGKFRGDVDCDKR